MQYTIRRPFEAIYDHKGKFGWKKYHVTQQLPSNINSFPSTLTYEYMDGYGAVNNQTPRVVQYIFP